MTSNQITGKIGEEYAIKYLLDNGFVILAQNTNYHDSEIDIVARNSSSKISLIEVKTTSVKNVLEIEYEIDPGTQIDKRKWLAMVRAREWFCNTKQIKWENTEILLAKVYLNQNAERIGESARVHLVKLDELHIQESL